MTLDGAKWVEAFQTMSLSATIAVALAINIAMFVVSLAGGHFLIHRYGNRRCADPPPPLTGAEIVMSIICVALNSAVLVAGVALLQHGWLRVIVEFPWWRPVVDVVVLTAAMDLAMYVLHRLAHWRRIYYWLHGPHHAHRHPRPLTLFVLHPAEVVGFGSLWLIVICVYPASWLGMTLYLALNLAFGTIGHLGVEPYPEGWTRNRWTKWISTSSFHAGHHLTPEHNFGFYTTSQFIACINNSF